MDPALERLYARQASWEDIARRSGPYSPPLPLSALTLTNKPPMNPSDPERDPERRASISVGPMHAQPLGTPPIVVEDTNQQSFPFPSVLETNLVRQKSHSAFPPHYSLDQPFTWAPLDARSSSISPPNRSSMPDLPLLGSNSPPTFVGPTARSGSWAAGSSSSFSLSPFNANIRSPTSSAISSQFNLSTPEDSTQAHGTSPGMYASASGSRDSFSYQSQIQGESSQGKRRESESSSSEDTSYGGGKGAGGDKGKGRKTSPGGGGGPGKGKDPKVKKKAQKACSHCQKAHLTCDDQRPCQRCVKKGMADTCVDGQRKKAKYLMDIDIGAPIISTPLSRARISPSHTAVRPQQPPPMPPLPPPSMGQPYPPQNQQRRSPTPIPLSRPDPLLFTQDGMQGPPMGIGDEYYGMDLLHESDPIFNLNFDPSYPFDSQAANLEYTMLSSIFADGNGNVGTPSSSASHPLGSGLSQPIFQLDQGAAWPDASSDLNIDPQNPNTDNTNGWNGFSANDLSMAQTPLAGPSGSGNGVASGSGLRQDGPRPHNPFAELSAANRARAGSGSALGLGGVGPRNDQRMGAMQASAVYSQVTKPYDYTEGYHFLMRYLTQNFSQEDTLKVVKSLSAFRPSMIALLMPLSVEDEVFLEKSFQRTLIELEKLISYSGTPTAIWRRTGELCLVGDEFCALTEFSRADLLGKKTYAYQLFDKPSVVAYFEKFSQHAFENTTQNFFLQCTVVSASGKQVPCSACFTVRRDVFDLPSVIIGQLLPIV